MLFFTLFTYFINTGCIIYPLNFTCFDNFNWGIAKEQVIRMNNHYELWSKAGLTPTSKVSNPSEYIQGFNWVKNWIDLYFFNKVSDFILGLIVTVFIVVFFFDFGKFFLFLFDFLKNHFCFFFLFSKRFGTCHFVAKCWQIGQTAERYATHRVSANADAGQERAVESCQRVEEAEESREES